MPPAERHETIIDTFEELGAGEAFVLVNDHDPKPQRYQFAAESPTSSPGSASLKDPRRGPCESGDAQPNSPPAHHRVSPYGAVERQ